MAYEGVHEKVCRAYEFSKVEVVMVSGAAINPFGHAILFADGMYFHVDGLLL